MGAALIYQRATSEADQRSADRLSTPVDGRQLLDDGLGDDDDCNWSTRAGA
jgi:hypothetical protein